MQPLGYISKSLKSFLLKHLPVHLCKAVCTYGPFICKYLNFSQHFIDTAGTLKKEFKKKENLK